MSNIIYAPKSWNPISGCSPVSEGCANCWAKSFARRQHQEWGTVHLHPDRLEQPLHWRKPQTVAVAFMGDLFHEQVPDEFIDKVFAVMALTPQHTYLLLTKRPERMRAYLRPRLEQARLGSRSVPAEDVFWPEGPSATRIIGEIARLEIGDGSRQPKYPRLPVWPLPNVFLGVSCENQARADERIPLLLEMKGWRKWASLEPLLGPIDLEDATGTFLRGIGNRLGLCVIGGESGPHARPCDLGWIRDIRDQCKAAGVACYVEQMGSAWAKERPTGVSGPVDFKGEGMRLWPLDLRVREWPEGSER